MAKKSCYKYQRVVITTIIILLHTLFLFFMCDFSKTLETYGDDFAYYSMAKSIFYGQGTQVHGVDFQFQNLLYSYLLVPFFLIKDSVRRMHMICLWNSFLMSLSLIPVWMLCKEFKLKKKFLWSVILIIFFWPDAITAGTMMSENLYWLLSLFAFWACIKSLNSDNIAYAAIAAVFSYAAYWCKEVAICIPLAFVGISVLLFTYEKFIKNPNGKKSEERTFSKNSNIRRIVVYVLVYIVIYLLFKYAVYGGVSSFYSHQMDSSFLKNLYDVLYLMYGFIYYIVAAIIAFLILPIVYPLIYIKKIDKRLQKTWLFMVILLLGTILVIVYTITVKEDLGRVTPRIHLRYFSPMIGVFLPIFFKSFEIVEKQDGDIQDNKIKNICYWTIIGIICFAVFKGVQGGCANENLSLQYTYVLSKIVPALNNVVEQGVVFYPTQIIVGGLIILCLLLFNVFQFGNKTKKITLTFFCSISLLICGANLISGNFFLRNAYLGNQESILEMKYINDYFRENDLIDANVMYVTTSWGNKNAKIYDTYFDGRHNYEMSIESLRNMVCTGEGGNIEVSKQIFNENIWGTPYSLEGIDYFIIGSDVGNIEELIKGVKLVDNISSSDFKVYRNWDFKRLKANISKTQDIKFMSDGYNVPLFDVTGVSWCEGAYSWTDGDEMTVSGVIDSELKEIEITVLLDNTFNGNQKIIVYQGDDIVYNGEAIGQQNFKFSMKPIDGVYSFKMSFPNAKSPAELGQSQDERKLAIALKEISIVGKN